MTMPGTRFRILALTLIAMAGFAVLVPGFGGPFILDDHSSITDNQALQADEWTWDAVRRAVLTNDTGPLGRPVSMLTFVANAMTTGLDPAPMKFTNAVLHAAAAILLGLLVLRLFEAAPMGLTARQQELAALLVTVCWAVHPIAVTSTLYVVQRMNLLAALFTFAALLAYLKARPWFFISLPRAAAWFAFALLLWALGVLSKENALLAPLYVLLMEWLVFNFRDERGQLRRGWRKFVLGSALVAAAIAIACILFEWQRIAGGFESRPFGMAERLLTQARVIWHYVGMILLPNHSTLGLFLDDIPLSTGLVTPWTTLLALASLAGWIAGAVLLRKRAPLISFGLLFFLAGHLMESTFIALEIAFEHRNYLPSAGILLALAGGVMLLAKRLELRMLEWLPLAAFGLFLAFFTVIRALHWSDMYMLSQLEAFHHPQSARAQTQLGFVYTQLARRAPEGSGWPEFYMDAAAEYFKQAVAADPVERTALFLWLLHSRAHGLPFPEEARAELLERLSTGLPTPDTPASLDMLFECVMEGCGVSPLELETAIRLTLENPKLKGENRSETLIVAAKYFRYMRNDAASTISLLAQAVEATPHEPRYRLYLAGRLEQSGNIDAALEQVQKARSLDELGVYEDEISALLKDIEKNSLRQE